MDYLQFPPNELDIILGKTLPGFKKKKIKYILIYVLLILYLSIPSFQIPYFEHNRFRVTSLMEQRAISDLMIYYPEQCWVDIGDVNPNLLKAIISMEDGSFFNHHGIDWKELKTSMRINERRGKSARGASTITMQLAKNLFLTTEKNFFRKAKELLIAFRFEKEVSKKGILQAYINAVEWGDGIFGIEKAAEEYFSKEPEELNVNECSRLAAVIPSPLKHKPNVNSSYVLRRSSIIRGRMGDIILFPEAENEKKRP
jgi:monofunctional biosynthetic peptidoglycan transglycosylase